MKFRRSHFYIKYRDLLSFNKNLLVSGICSLAIAAIITEYYDVNFNHRSNIILVSFVSLLAEYVVETPIFVTLFYRDIKNRYIETSNEQKDPGVVRKDIKKLFTAYSISDLVYSIVQII